jgi:hypothetical protein
MLKDSQILIIYSILVLWVAFSVSASVHIPKKIILNIILLLTREVTGSRVGDLGQTWPTIRDR